MVFTHLFPFVSEIFLGFFLLPALLASPMFNKWNKQNQSCSPVLAQTLSKSTELYFKMLLFFFIRRITVLAAICLTQAFMMWKFINFQLRRWREHSQAQTLKKKQAPSKSRSKKDKGEQPAPLSPACACLRVAKHESARRELDGEKLIWM